MDALTFHRPAARTPHARPGAWCAGRPPHLSMRRRADQAIVRAGLLLLLLLLLLPSATAAAADAPAPAGSSGERLRKECNSLIATAIKTSHGWGWAAPRTEPDAQVDATPTDDAGGRRRAPAAAKRKPAKASRPVPRGEIDVRRTAAAGLVLHLAGTQLGDAALTRAAFDVARALANVQQPTGQIPRVGILANTAGGRDAPALVPDRAATTASIALLLTIVAEDPTPDERLTRAATRAATWLAAQQLQPGGWQVAYTPPGAANPVRLVRLDTADYRDGTAALLMAAAVLGDEKIVRRSGEAIGQLLAMRGSELHEDAQPLWAPAYRLTGEPTEQFGDLPYAIDTVASRYAMQTLVAACLLGKNPAGAPTPFRPTARASAPALAAAAKGFAALPRKNNEWGRFYHLVTAKPLIDPAAPPDDGPRLFEPPRTGEDGTDPALLPEILAAAQAIGSVGLEKHLASAGSDTVLFRPQHRVAIMLCGLGSDALTTPFPATPAAVEQYVKRDESSGASLEGPIPPDLPGRLDRLRRLLAKATLESAR